MRIVFDPADAQANVRKHALDLADAELVFAGITYTVNDPRGDFAEPRYVTLGLLAEVAVAIAHTERRDEVRVISMRQATRNEQAIYFENI